MIRAKFRSKENEIVYLLGLSARNVTLLRSNAPILFDGAELGLKQWIMIACVVSPEDMQPLIEKYEPENGWTIAGFAFTQARLDKLVTEKTLAIPLKNLGLEGVALFVYGETEEEIAAQYLRLTTPPPVPGFRDVLDPITGKLARVLSP